MLIELENYGHGKGLAIRIFERSLREPAIAERVYEPPPAWFNSDEQYVIISLPDPPDELDSPEKS